MPVRLNKINKATAITRFVVATKLPRNCPKGKLKLFIASQDFLSGGDKNWKLLVGNCLQNLKKSNSENQFYFNQQWVWKTQFKLLCPENYIGLTSIWKTKLKNQKEFNNENFVPNLAVLETFTAECRKNVIAYFIINYFLSLFITFKLMTTYTVTLFRDSKCVCKVIITWHAIRNVKSVPNLFPV